jgi:hypothetical protein
MPDVISNFQRYLEKFASLSADQDAADYGFLLRHADMQNQAGIPLLDHGKITGNTPTAFSSTTSPGGMFFTPRYRAFEPAMEPLFRGSFRESLQGQQIHEMGHFYLSPIAMSSNDLVLLPKQRMERMSDAEPTR